MKESQEPNWCETNRDGRRRPCGTGRTWASIFRMLHTSREVKEGILRGGSQEEQIIKTGIAVKYSRDSEHSCFTGWKICVGENEVGWGQIVKVLDYQPKRVGIYHTEMRSHWRLVRSWKPHFRRLLWGWGCAKEIRKDRMSHEKLENGKYQYVLGQTSPFSSICWLGLRGRHSSRGQMNNLSHPMSPSPNSPRLIQPHSLEQAHLGESQVQLCAAPPPLFIRHI